MPIGLEIDPPETTVAAGRDAMALTPRSLDEAISLLHERYGHAALHRGGDPVSGSVWSTGMPVFDEVLLPGGLPVGRVTVIAGAAPRATGRLSLLQTLLATASQSMQVVYVDLPGTLDPGILFDLGLDGESCLVVRPPSRAIGPGLAMARSLVRAGVPWVGVAFPNGSERSAEAWRHPLTALADAAWTGRAVLCVSAPAPLPRPLAYASSLTLISTKLAWHEDHDDIVGMRVQLTVSKSKVGAPGAMADVLIGYPRPHKVPSVVGLPSVMPPYRDLDDAASGDELRSNPPVALPVIAG